MNHILQIHSNELNYDAINDNDDDGADNDCRDYLVPRCFLIEIVDYFHQFPTQTTTTTILKNIAEMMEMMGEDDEELEQST